MSILLQAREGVWITQAGEMARHFQSLQVAAEGALDFSAMTHARIRT